LHRIIKTGNRTVQSAKHSQSIKTCVPLQVPQVPEPVTWKQLSNSNFWH